MSRALKRASERNDPGIFSPYLPSAGGAPRPIIIPSAICRDLCEVAGIDPGPYRGSAWSPDRAIPAGHENAWALLKRVAELIGAWPALQKRAREHPRSAEQRQAISDLRTAAAALLARIDDLDADTRDMLATPPQDGTWYRGTADLDALAAQLEALDADAATADVALGQLERGSSTEEPGRPTFLMLLTEAFYAHATERAKIARQNLHAFVETVCEFGGIPLPQDPARALDGLLPPPELFRQVS